MKRITVTKSGHTVRRFRAVLMDEFIEAAPEFDEQTISAMYGYEIWRRKVKFWINHYEQVEMERAKDNPSRLEKTMNQLALNRNLLNWMDQHSVDVIFTNQEDMD